MDETLQEKYDRLKAVIGSLGPALVAFSGGVDSSLLLKAALDVHGEKTVAATVRSVLNQPGELDHAVNIARTLGANHVVLNHDPLDLEAVRHNRRDRCYHCKNALAKVLTEKARTLGLSVVLEGSQADDAAHYRPGAKALRENGIKSPMADAGLTKTEVRQLSRHLGLTNWNRPAGGCLATRFPYDTSLDARKLEQVFHAEQVLADLDVFGGRTRHHGNLVRIEVPAAALDRLADPTFRQALITGMKSCGFELVTVDMEGYRTGVYDYPSPA